MQTTYTVSGMTCGHCANHVTEEVPAIDGVKGVSVAVEGPMVIESDERHPFDAVIAAVAEAGDYTVVEA
ncbi:MAG: heavy-metal-associated domain-containing protein [Tessaracoccus sp.]